MAGPRIEFEFADDPRRISRDARVVADELLPAFVSDLVESRFADTVAKTIRMRVRQRGQGRFGQQLPPLSRSYVRALQRLGISRSARTLTRSGTLLDNMIGDEIGGQPVVRFTGVHTDRTSPTTGTRDRITNSLLALFHEEGTRPPRRRGTGFRDRRQRTGARRKGDSGGMPAAPFFGLTRGEESGLTTLALQLFQGVTLPRLLADWERE